MTKQKSKRTVNRNTRGTLDKKHTEQMNNFEKLYSSVSVIKQQLRDYQDEYNEIIDPYFLREGGSRQSATYGTQDTHLVEYTRKKTQLLEEIKRLQSEIDTIENCSDSLNYISNTLPYLVNYYDNNTNDVTENKEASDENTETEIVHGKKSVISYFMNAKDNPVKDRQTKNNSGSKTNKPLNANLSKAKLYSNYINVINYNDRKVDTSLPGVCNMQDCDGAIIHSQADGCLVCDKCGTLEKILTVPDKHNCKDTTHDTGAAYKRINHLTEILSQLQAKESTDIPQKVFDMILREIKKRKINKNELEIFRLRRILKTLDLRKYYEHASHILQILTGKEPPNFSRKDETMIKKMFKDIQKPFAIYCPPNRKNFLNYSYVLHKFCELLELDSYIGYFPLLKNNSKLRQHDKIWRNICKYMKWEFYKSI